jgi:hypothetical protein
VTTFAGAIGQFGADDGVGANARFGRLSAIVSDGAGNLFLADTDQNVIRKIVVATAEVTTLAGSPGAFGSDDGVGSAARFAFPRGLALDRSGHLYVGEMGNPLVRRVSIATGEVKTVVGVPGRSGVLLGALPARLTQPGAVAFLPSGDLAIVDENAVLLARF